MKQALTFTRWLAISALILMLIAIYGFGYEQLRSFTFIAVVIWIITEIALRNRASNSETENNG
jgi:hypothetical protein